MYIDCDVRFGRSFGTRNLGGHNISAQGLVEEMDKIGIDKAMVFHTLAWEYHPTVGNAELLEELKGHEDRLLGCWVLLPHHTGEMDHPTQLVREMLSNNILAARICPNFHANSHRFELTEWCIGELLSELEEARMPLVIDFGLFRREQPPFRDIYSICDNHPNLPVILMGVQARNNRSLYPLIKRFKNLHLQTAGYFVHRGLEHFVNTFGSSQLVLGSGFPVQNMGAARFHVDRALIAEEDRKKISGGNLLALLNGVRTRVEL